MDSAYKKMVEQVFYMVPYSSVKDVSLHSPLFLMPPETPALTEYDKILISAEVESTVAEFDCCLNVIKLEIPESN
jgi:hypothetical protein